LGVGSGGKEKRKRRERLRPRGGGGGKGTNCNREAAIYPGGGGETEDNAEEKKGEEALTLKIGKKRSTIGGKKKKLHIECEAILQEEGRPPSKCSYLGRGVGGERERGRGRRRKESGLKGRA